MWICVTALTSSATTRKGRAVTRNRIARVILKLIDSLIFISINLIDCKVVVTKNTSSAFKNYRFYAFEEEIMRRKEAGIKWETFSPKTSREKCGKERTEQTQLPWRFAVKPWMLLLQFINKKWQACKITQEKFIFIEGGLSESFQTCEAKTYTINVIVVA